MILENNLVITQNKIESSKNETDKTLEVAILITGESLEDRICWN